MFSLEIRTGGSAYRDEDGNLDTTNYELIRNLAEISRKLENGCTSGVVMDVNGNKVGKWSIEE